MDSDNEIKSPVVSHKGRRNIKFIKELEDLEVDTRIANRNEKERVKRIEEKEKRFQEAFSNKKYENQLILDYDFENDIPLVTVHEALVKQLKSHQKQGVKFMWNACFESLEEIKKSQGSGCILAHCMGLGKTFQVIALVHTLLSHESVGTKNVLICCPKNTLLNWISEFEKWITPDLGTINVYNPTRWNDYTSRLKELASWHKNGGVCIINYELLRISLENDVKSTNLITLSQRRKFQEYLGNPGPDIIICDEGHVLKNEETKLSKIMRKIRTLRRIVLTGTPMQNNLIEYHCMVQFVKPNLLGTRKEFLNMFVNPILNGQYENSLEQDVQLMKERSHILHKKLLGCVQRFDLTTLKTFLPVKHEYVVSIALTDSQTQMYRFYLQNYLAKGNFNGKNENMALFTDYQSLQRIWTHPYCLKIHAEKYLSPVSKGNHKKKKRRKILHKQDAETDESSESEMHDFSRYPLNWWVQFVTSEDVGDVRKSNKLVMLLKVLKECEEAGEKVLVFSGSLYSLEMIEHFLKKINESEFEDPCLMDMTSSWEIEQDYLVLTGKTSSEDRDRYCRIFNNVQDSRLRLFLISTKAGGMGINLTAANRAVLFDVSWNPSHDIQSIFRIYRIGQAKPCFVYRLVASGTMEEKIYERQVAKQSISFRVIDEKQIARHYTERELLELYQLVPDKEYKIEDIQTKDPLLQKIVKDEPGIAHRIHEHDSLLEHKEEEELHEIEKKDAWTAYDNVNNLKRLPRAEEKMLETLVPESFDPECFKEVLKNEYKEATDAEINTMMEELLPKIYEILKRPDFIDIMKRQALRHHGISRIDDNSAESDKDDCPEVNETVELDDKDDFSNKENLTKLLNSFKINKTTDNDADSDDYDFVRTISKSKRRKSSKKPLKVWGSRGGKDFGSPDSCSD